MPGGRPPKPVERKRHAGNPGKRPLPDPVVALAPAPAGAVPAPPEGLGPAGLATWGQVWTYGRT